jgi:hypothetical protein
MLIDGSRISVSLATADFRPDREGTRLGFTEEGAFLDETPARRDKGMGGLVDAPGTGCRASEPPPDTHVVVADPRRAGLTSPSAACLLGCAACCTIVRAVGRREPW